MSIDQTNLQLDDQELVHQAQMGSREAISELIVRHHVAVRWLIGRYFRDPATIDDLAQDVFCDAMTGIDKLENANNFRSWLLSLARNKSVSHLRKLISQKKRQSELELWLLQQTDTDSESEGYNALDSTVALEKLHECLVGLSPKHRSLISQFYFDGRSAIQIARDNLVKDTAVRAMLFRVRKALRKCVLKKLALSQPDTERQ